MKSTAPRKKMKHVWMVEDAPSSPGEAPRTFWTKIGIAVENEDGSLSLTLSAIPVTGKMIIRDESAPVTTPLSGKRGVA